MKSLLSKGKKVTSVLVSSVMLSLTLTSTMNLQVSADNMSRQYNVFDATSGNFIKSYTLEEIPVIDKSREVLGTDERVVDFTKSGVVKIVHPDGLFATGFIIDDHTIATAAHCVKKSSTKSQLISNIYVFDSNGNVEKNITDAVQIHAPVSNQCDYALITVSEDLSDYAIFNLGFMMENFADKNKAVSCTGFPGTLNGEPYDFKNDENNVNSPTKHTMYTSNGIVHRSDMDVEFFHTCDASAGDSGAPVYITSSFNNKVYYTVIGIHGNVGVDPDDGEIYNVAAAITTDAIHFFKNNPYIEY